MTTIETGLNGHNLRCSVCQEEHEIELPAPLWAVTALCKAWIRRHRACRQCRADQMPDPASFVRKKLARELN